MYVHVHVYSQLACFDLHTDTTDTECMYIYLIMCVCVSCDCHVTQVVGDWDCMLNQTNIGQNNNKFYVIQLLQRGGKFHVWNRWGRVGEGGQTAMKGPFQTAEVAEKEFCKKFKDKTRNSWEERENFTAVKGKYTLLEMDEEEGDEQV